MRFERMIRLTMLTGAALALPGVALAAPLRAPGAAVAGQSGPQSAPDYQWIDRADALWDAIGDAPPDFAFSFEGQEPWAWQTADGYTIIVEDAGEGGIRSYYFAPGGRGPFLAVEPGMSFAYEGGRLAMVYDADGEAAPRGEFGDYDDAAGDLYARALRLRAAMNPGDYRPVDADAWIDASPYIFGFIQLWDEGRVRYPGWASYHRRSDAAAWRRRFEDEQRRRREQALRFSHWRQGGFQGPPPGRYHAPGQPGRPGAGRPPQPGTGNPTQPGAGRPPQPGSGWSHQPGGGRPPQPGRPGRPGGWGTNPPPQPGGPAVTPPAGGAGTPMPPPVTRPGNARPDGTPGWRRGRPGGGAPSAPATVPLDNPGAPVPQTPDARPPRSGSNGGWQRPTRPAPDAAPMPVPPVVVEAPPAVQPAPPRGRPEGGWRRPGAPSGDASSAPAPAPAPRFRPMPRSEPDQGYRPPSAAPRPSFAPSAPRGSPPAQAAPAPRVSAPPAPPPVTRSAPPPPPASRPAPPPRTPKTQTDD